MDIGNYFQLGLKKNLKNHGYDGNKSLGEEEQVGFF
jgi:hypothetical protein